MRLAARPRRTGRRDRQHTSERLERLRRQYSREQRAERPPKEAPEKTPSPRLPGKPSYLYRRLLAVGVAAVMGLALVAAVVLQGTGAPAQDTPPINPNSAAPDTPLASAEGLTLTTPVRPADITALGYHPDGESLLPLDPRGKNLSSNALLRSFRGGTPEDLAFHIMDPAGRPGPVTGALDVGSEAGTRVYAPVDGTITAVRDDPSIPEASVIEVQPTDHPQLRVSVTLIGEIREGIGVDSQIRAGSTELGKSADAARFLKTQLSEYTSGDGNHVTLYVSGLTG